MKRPVLGSWTAKTLELWILAPLLLAVAGGATWAQAVPPADPQSLDHELQALKEDVLELNRDLLLLREELLFPASSQLAVYVSLDTEELFRLDSVQLLLNDRMVASHLYSPRELKALGRGGVHQLYIGNVHSGEHELVAFFTGVGPNGRDYRRAAHLTISKAHGPKALELRISDLQRKLQPEFVVREWQ